ncbi:hypothetical protein GALLR39Z86_06030 [Glycomyces algeriensis]|uniref:Uncharacterized protein n=1 Tax=Glycomyces algeriensis TaxID=256037 RepID=A0A9W6LEL3_9ACTN|nr:hypothetical protein GALLR39Z86_06030 [Glycomyces algeriensis]
MTREFTPENIRQIGGTTLPAVASSYEDLKTLVVDAKSSADATFGGFITGSAADQFNTLWGRFVTVAEETPETLADMGRTLVEIADGYDADEQEAALDLESALAGLEDAYVENLAETDG